jgi:ribosomal protein L40E/DNA repair exonuclease SbcCD ATPase subunit
MALRALTPGKAAYCSDCGAGTPPDAEKCEKCGARFEGFMDAVLCPICNSVNPAETKECKKCSAKFPEIRSVDTGAKPPDSSPEEEYLRNILRLSREKAKARVAQGPPPPPISSSQPVSMTEGDREEGDLEAYLWKLAEPFDKMIDRRKQRLGQMDTLIERARARIKTLESSTNDLEVREREELKRQIEELLLEKEDILKIEEGLVDMENTYRNILRMQQDELKAKESSLRARIEAFRMELEKRERTFGQMRERESDIVRREDEFRILMNRMHERERELEKREELLRDKGRLLDERHHAMSEAEVDLERRRWALEQRASTEGAPVKGSETMITVGPAQQEMTDLKARMTQMEEQLEKLQAEKAELANEQKSLQEFRDTIKNVMKDLDELLGELPDEKIRRFAKSDRFATYEKVMDQLEL